MTRPVLAALLLAASAAQAAQAPVLDPAKWQALLGKAAAVGRRSPHETLESRSLAHVTPDDKTRPRSAEYFTAIGYVDSENQFVVTKVSLVSEAWSRPEAGVWQIEQRLADLSPQGEFRGLSRQMIIEKDDGELLDYKSLPSDGPGEQVRLDALLKSWFGWERPERFTRRG